jgi:hypothetical protein
MGYGHRTPYWESHNYLQRSLDQGLDPQHPHGRVGNANASIPGGKGRREERERREKKG